MRLLSRNRVVCSHWRRRLISSGFPRLVVFQPVIAAVARRRKQKIDARSRCLPETLQDDQYQEHGTGATESQSCFDKRSGRHCSHEKQAATGTQHHNKNGGQQAASIVSVMLKSPRHCRHFLCTVWSKANCSIFPCKRQSRQQAEFVLDLLTKPELTPGSSKNSRRI